jgi:hypothetical protein
MLRLYAEIARLEAERDRLPRGSSQREAIRGAILMHRTEGRKLLRERGGPPPQALSFQAQDRKRPRSQA